MAEESNDNNQESQENTVPKREVISDYRNILDSAKKSLAYAALLLVITVISGSIHLFGFLWASDLLWLASTIEYKTILTWGMPVTILFLIAGSLILSLHTKYAGIKLQYIMITLTVLILVIAFILGLYKLTGISTVFYTFLFSYILFSVSVIAEIIDKEDDPSDKGAHLFFRFIYISLPVLVSVVFYLGTLETKVMNKGHFPAVAIYEGKPWGVMLNNGGSFVITDLNNTSRIQIVAPNEIKFFVHTEEEKAKYNEDLNTSDINSTLDSNRTHTSH